MIEAGVMTLVVKGKDDYFQTNTGGNDVLLELEDVITIHIMGGCEEETAACIVNQVENLIVMIEAQDDNTVSSDQITDPDGYALNGAFNMEIDRSAMRAHLEPSRALLNICPFELVRPAGNIPIGSAGNIPCVTRRDVRYRGYPYRNGGYTTALEIYASASEGRTCADGTTTETAQQSFTSMLGYSQYAQDLADLHSQAINAGYNLNGRYRRAYMINPGYEWLPTQPGYAPGFRISQKLFMFAPIALDEGRSDLSSTGSDAPASYYPATRRRMLLSV